MGMGIAESRLFGELRTRVEYLESLNGVRADDSGAKSGKHLQDVADLRNEVVRLSADVDTLQTTKDKLVSMVNEVMGHISNLRGQMKDLQKAVKKPEKATQE